MDDLQFRRSIYADPHSNEDELAKAKATDPSKQKFAQEIEQLDEKILSALKVPVPEELSERLILRQTLESHQQEKKKKRVHLALAASVAFVMGLTINFMQFSSAYTNVGDYAFAHVAHESEYFTNTDEANVTLASLNQKMEAFNGSFADTLGELIFADYCRFDGMKSLHLVYKGINSPVNVFVIPKNDHLEFNSDFSKSDLNGKTQQFKDANIIVVGDKTERLDTWQQNIKANVRWSI
jgi:hypothetical protein